jgi:hypothetical protein
MQMFSAIIFFVFLRFIVCPSVEVVLPSVTVRTTVFAT